MRGFKILTIAGMFFLYSCYKEDITSPEIELNGDENLNIELYNNYVEKGATANDDKDGNLTSSIQIVNNIVLNKLGKYAVTYTVTDKSGNTALKYRYVNVIFTTSTDTLKNDTIAPVITLFGTSPMFVKTGNPYNEPGATAMDNIYGDLTPFIIFSNNVNTMMNGTYTATYTVTGLTICTFR